MKFSGPVARRISSIFLFHDIAIFRDEKQNTEI